MPAIPVLPAMSALPTLSVLSTLPPQLSIIIPAYNEEKYIEKTLQSISAQPFSDYEVIVVANGCTDKTEELLKDHHKNDRRIRYFSLPKANVSIARNAGAVNAQSEMLLFLDADTQLAPESLPYLHREFKNGLAVATTKARPDASSWKFWFALRIKNLYNSLQLYQGCSGALICRKADFQKVGGYDPELMVREQRKLILQLKKLGEYQCLNTHVTTSMRRYQQWGLTKLLWFWMKQWFNDKLGELKGKEYELVR